MEVRRGDFDDPATQALLRHHLEGMHANSPPGHVFALDWSGLQAPGVTFWTIHDDDGAVLGCGALNEVDPAHGEIKSMRVWPQQAGRGVGHAMLEHIIAAAGARGYRRLSLETGSGYAFEAALALYRRRGFAPSPAFGDYAKSDFNQFMTLEL